MSVRRAQAEIDSAEFAEWQAYFGQIEPHGAWRGDVHAGIVAAAIRNTFASSESEVANPADYLPNFDHEPEDNPDPPRDVRAEAEQARLTLHMLRLARQSQEKSSPP